MIEFEYFQIAQLCEEAAKGGVTVVHNETGKLNSYAFKDSDWVSYDSATEIKQKVGLYLLYPRPISLNVNVLDEFAAAI